MHRSGLVSDYLSIILLCVLLFYFMEQGYHTETSTAANLNDTATVAATKWQPTRQQRTATLVQPHHRKSSEQGLVSNPTQTQNQNQL